MDVDQSLRARRLAAQRLTPATACKSAEEAALAVIGVQAQDLRAAALALRSRVPGLTRSAISAAPLLRTWTVRGTVHLIAASDRPWLHALFAKRNVRTFGARFERFGIAEEVNAMRQDVVELCAELPRDRPSLLAALVEATPRFSRVRSTHSFRGFQRRASSSPTRPVCCTRPIRLRRSTPTRRSRSLAPATAQAMARATHTTSRSGPRCPSHRRGGRSKAPDRRTTLTRGPPMTRRPICCSPPSTRSCSATARASRSSPQSTTTTS